MSAYICTHTDAENNMFHKGRTYRVIEQGPGRLLGLADDRGYVRYISPSEKCFIVRNDGNWVSYPRYAYFQPAPTLN